MHPFVLAIASIAGMIFMIRMDNSFMTIPYCTGIFVFVASLSFVLSGRARFSILLAWILIGFLTIVSAIKYRMKGFSLHFYDFVVMAKDFDILIANSNYQVRTVYTTSWRGLGGKAMLNISCL